ncbi:hypothetical protein BN159_6042 [Streptomyces davaonensis JCM 4913]|uniref:Thioesterase TesA-like domain-containing protein n=1 Tax=Streptomyces davaonensis (strain DSM 101723 / JCM 4913 / KCC S-0913 / 768) TaxID=1214101 RepID=K4R2C8_STRDJ|nr:thioesterase domain-containing protein [Streptomyces davaonensis]CCK30421.1 hypothetical protein BN159_6042 [Streptomyces davaonensis JCM 4913]
MRTDAAARPHSSAQTSTRGQDSPWIVGRVTPPSARLRLICLPQAGGSAGSFAPWRLAPPSDVELATVELPGRGVRSAEPLPDTLEALADAVLDGVAAELRTPYAVFGHSFGALLAHRITVRAGERGLPSPRALFVSASRAPHIPVPARIADRDDEGLLRWLAGFGGFPPELRAYPAYLSYALRTVRRDLALTERYLTDGPVPVDCPVHILGGSDDPLVSADQLAHWRACAPAGHSLRQLPGGHDYLFTGAPAVLDVITAALR